MPLSSLIERFASLPMPLPRPRINPRGPAGNGAGGDVLQVLLIKDSVALRSGLALLLRTHGFRVAGVAGSVDEGYRLFKARRPDVTVIDMALGDVNGAAAVRRILELDVQPAGTGLVLGLRPDGSQLIDGARVQLRVSRHARTVFTHDSTLGQLFPGSDLNYRIPWEGRPTEGDYHVVGTIRPQGAPVVNIDETIAFTPAKATELKRKTPPSQTTSILPAWVWVVLGAAAALLIALLVAVWKLRRRPDALAVPMPRP